MKKLLLALFILLAFSLSTASAAPFLVCDPQAGVERYVLEINNVETPEFPAQPDGSLRYDLVALPPGDFTVKAKAGNIWGWSDWSSPLEDTKVLPWSPKGLRVSGESSGE